jgi:NitT/TauT family transport system substrate-binding protein
MSRVMRERTLVMLVGLVLLCACAPAAPGPAPTAASSAPAAAAKPAGATSTPAKVTINYGYSTAGAINAPVYLAEEYGYFADQGITLNYVLFPSASEVIPSITRGDVDVAAIGINPATLNALAGNFGIKLVADTGTQFQGFPLNVVVVTNEMAGTIKGPADLKGHKIALTPPGMGTASGFLLSKYLAQGNLTVNDVDIVPLTFQDQVAALTNRSVDVAFMAEPFATQVVKQNIGKILTGSDTMLPGYQVTGLLYTDKFMSNQHDAAQGFMIAFLKGVRAYMAAFGGNATDRDKVIQVMTKRTDLKDAALWNEMIPTGSSPDGAVDLPSIAAAQAYFKGLGLVQNTPDPATLVNTSFAQEAVRQLGPGAAPVPPKKS